MGFMSKVVGFTVAYAEWVKEGRPRRSPEWVRELFAICQKCPFFASNKKGPFGDYGVCTKCGCHVGSDAENWRNKLIMPTQPCPIGNWDATIEKRRDVPAWKERILEKQRTWKGEQNGHNNGQRD